MLNFLRPIYDTLTDEKVVSMRYNEFDASYASRVRSFVRHLKFLQVCGLRKRISKYMILSNFEIWIWDDLQELYGWYFELYETDRYLEVDKPFNRQDNMMYLLTMMFNEHILPLWNMYLGKTLINESLMYEDTRFNKLPRLSMITYDRYEPMYVIEMYCIFVKNALIQLIREDTDGNNGR